MNKQPILDLVAKYQKLVNTQSRELFDEVFANHELCNMISITNHFPNREAVYNDFLIGRIQARFSRIELIADEIIVNEISDDLAIVVFKYHTDCDLRENGQPHSIEGLETQVIVKQEGEWKILHVHYSK